MKEILDILWSMRTDVSQYTIFRRYIKGGPHPYYGTVQSWQNNQEAYLTRLRLSTQVGGPRRAIVEIIRVGGVLVTYVSEGFHIFTSFHDAAMIKQIIDHGNTFLSGHELELIRRLSVSAYNHVHNQG